MIERVGSTHTPGLPGVPLNYRSIAVVGWARAPASWVPVALQGLTGLPSHQVVPNMQMFHVKHYSIFSIISYIIFDQILSWRGYYGYA